MIIPLQGEGWKHGGQRQHQVRHHAAALRGKGRAPKVLQRRRARLRHLSYGRCCCSRPSLALRLLTVERREHLWRGRVKHALVGPLTDEAREAHRETALYMHQPSCRQVHGGDRDVGAAHLPHLRGHEPVLAVLSGLDALSRAGHTGRARKESPESGTHIVYTIWCAAIDLKPPHHPLAEPRLTVRFGNRQHFDNLAKFCSPRRLLSIPSQAHFGPFILICSQSLPSPHP